MLIGQDTKTITGAKIIIETLKGLGVDTIFGYPGGIVLGIYDELFEYILNTYRFKNGQQFFYNYAVHSDSVRIKELVYDYFIENFSHVVFDNMDMYEALIEK